MASSEKMPPLEPPSPPSWREQLWVWLKIGLLSFGGPAGQIALMQRELVERKRWISDRRFFHALNYCLLLPGPEAQQLAIYTGWLLHRRWGGIMAGALFVIPGAILIWGISVLYVYAGQVPWVEALFYGLKPAVMAIVIGAAWRIGRKVLHRLILGLVAAFSFVALFWLNIPFPWVILGAALFGLVLQAIRPNWAQAAHASPSSGGAEEGFLLNETSPGQGKPTIFSTVRTIVAWSAIWLFPLIGCVFLFGPQSIFVREGVFFSQAALMTFGGAYAVLPYVAQQAVENHGWLTTAQMMDGLGLAETTPGPLILVLQFVGFLGGWNEGGFISPLWSATLAAFITTWVTFVPGFLFIFAGAPYVEATRGNLKLAVVLSVITAAVAGVVLNLAVWFSWQVIFPRGGTPDWFALGLAAALLYAMQRHRMGVISAIGLAAGLGFLRYLFLLL